jgi:hypothetical protein
MAQDFATMLGIYVYALYALAAYSVTYRDNSFFKFAEHSYLALAVAYAGAVSYGYVRRTAIDSILTGKDWTYIFPVLFGVLYIFFFSKKYFYLYRFPMAIVTGTGVGLAMSGTISAQFIQQITATIVLPLYVVNPLLGFQAMDTINNWLIIIMVLGTLAYFFFSIQPETAFGKVTTKLGLIGRWTMMIAFGSAFGNTVMTRMNLFIGVYKNLLRDYTSFLGLTALILIVATLEGQKAKKTEQKA